MVGLNRKAMKMFKLALIFIVILLEISTILALSSIKTQTAKKDTSDVRDRQKRHLRFPFNSCIAVKLSFDFYLAFISARNLLIHSLNYSSR